MPSTRLENLSSLSIVALITLAGLKSVFGLASFSLNPVQVGAFANEIYVAVVLVFFGVGMTLLAGSRNDYRAVYLGGMYLCGGAAFANSLLPDTGAVNALRHVHPDAFVPLFLWLFIRDFPRILSIQRGHKLMQYGIVLSTIGGALLFGLNLLTAVLALVRPYIELPALLELFASRGKAGLYWTVLFAIAIPAMPFMIYNSRRAGAAERRRATLFACGIAAGCAPLMIIIFLEGLIPSFLRFMNQPHIRYWSGFLVYPAMLSVPLSTAYAVLRHHVLDVRIIVRKALQYALARYTVLLATAVPLLALSVYLYAHRNQTIVAIVTGKGAGILLGFSLAGWMTLKSRQSIFRTLDRRFFREQYDANVILAKVAQDIANVTEFEQFTSTLTSQIEKAFHPESIFVMLADNSVGQFRCTRKAMRALDATAEVANLLLREGRPVTIDYDSIAARLPVEEREWLAEGAFRLVVPFISTEATLLGFIGLGEKKSELPYTRDDQFLLRAISASASIALERRICRVGGAAVDDMQDTAQICANCERIQPSSTSECAACGGNLKAAAIPYVLLGKFRFERLIGRGGMGVVYKAMDLDLRRPIAIKTLPWMSPANAMRLREEARSIASVAHPTLAIIFGAETWRGQPMLILEYLPLGSLHNRIKTKRLSYSEAVSLGVTMADVLASLHATGMLHRDVKPSNIAYLDSSTPKLLDFGLAQIIRGRTSTGTCARVLKHADEATTVGDSRQSAPSSVQHIAGTAPYMSPELIRGGKLTPGIDLWALCIVLYEALTGVNPVLRATIEDTFRCIVSEPIPDIRTHLSDCPEPLALFLKEALSADASVRPGSAVSVRNRLSQMAGSVL